ncbi:beta-N-acetylglucosaminidase [Corynebacterium aurimucosum]|uniref:Beta-N-acetylhexosaminidase n=1 Tax=Corynebacterium aurimucosum (strain ATCC 700975 / DSM 44827 / CIP 107346 / CN-1) TaxID=548476 RepID=C3PEQ0_CORA7|nr:beta-N-acetylglucosaminidase [Corynebacterium aurimucosum]ACP32304.1 beta-N-acetylhexosaminidase [Corynebacterium aurimucosum ATCC 700975]QQU93508.1 beta-N-acetylglucosaminidase [Corynebacterium aurimucosum]
MRLTSRFTAAASAVLATGCLLSACGKDDVPSPEPTPASEATTAAAKKTSAPAPATSAEESETTTPATSESADSSEAEDESSTRSSADRKDKDKDASESAEPSGKFTDSVEQAYKIFGGLVPEEIFAQFDRCDPNGVTDSFNCSGSEVGQFQFFKSKTKASQTTQVLTELRSSRVIEDSGNRVVGWSMLGNTAILTVVDNDEGLIMQQMISTDQDDPEERLKELGLV